MADLYFFRDTNGNEIDLVFQKGRDLIAIEIKSGSTFSSSQLKGIKKFKKISDKVSHSFLVNSGSNMALSEDIDVINFKNIDSILNL